ncbi:MAG: DUF6694 family lipoprotein [Planctomycetota bacterium]
MTMLRLAVVVLVLLAGCSGRRPTLDATSKESFERSLIAVTNGLTCEEKAQVARVVLMRMLKAASETRDADAVRRALHGLSARQLLAEPDDLPAVPR